MNFGVLARVISIHPVRVVAPGSSLGQSSFTSVSSLQLDDFEVEGTGERQHVAAVKPTFLLFYSVYLSAIGRT
jgi:hypothetical protein